MSEIVVKKYANIDKLIDTSTEAGILKTCILVAAQAKALQVPDTGRLRNSIMYKTQKTEGGLNDSAGEKSDKSLSIKAKNLEGYVGSALEYSIYEEFGTRYRPAKPYLRPAIQLVVKGAGVNEVTSAIKREFEAGPIKKNKKLEKF